MAPTDLTADLVIDLLRSAWVVESARAEVYRIWEPEDGRFSGSRERAERGAAILAVALTERARDPDAGLVAQHAEWMLALVGETPREIPLGDLFLARLGDWVEGHASPFLSEGSEELNALGRAEKESLAFPENLPQPPAFEPLPVPAVEPPGDVLFRFGILADMHAGSKAGEQLTRAAISDLNSAGVDLVVQLGDITDHGDLDEFETAAQLLGGLDMPWYTMMGNHDVYSVSEDRLSGREYFEKHLGRPADGQMIEHKGYRFALLDSAEHWASPFAPFDFVTGTFLEGTGGAVVRGALSDPQHEILADVAAPGAGPAFVFLHHPPQPFVSFPPVVFGLRDADSGRLHATCDSGNVWGVFAGHTHRNARARDYDGVPVQEVGIPRDFPCGYAVVDVTRHGYAYRFLQISDEELLRSGYSRAGQIHRRYGRGSERERAFVWLDSQA